MAQSRAPSRKPGMPQPLVRVLLVEDIPTAAATVQATLQQAGMEVAVAETGGDALDRKARFRPDIALVDLDLPDVAGFELIEAIARDGDCGIILLTANDEESARVMALERGADDYLVKPAAPRELVARIRALHRRLGHVQPTGTANCIHVEPALRCLIGPDGGRTPLTEAEMAALGALLEAEGSSVSRDRLSQIALKRPLHAEDRAVDQLVMKLRRKLAARGASERVILSARREGYVIAEPGLFRMMPRPAGPGLNGAHDPASAVAAAE